MSEILVNKLTGTSTAGSILVTGEGNSTTTNLQQGLAKVWVTFDGTASGATVRDSFNVASTDDDGTGLYGVNFSSAMSTANYSSVCNRASFAGTTAGGANACTVTAGSITKLQTYDSNGTLGDRDNNTAHVLGDLA